MSQVPVILLKPPLPGFCPISGLVIPSERETADNVVLDKLFPEEALRGPIQLYASSISDYQRGKAGNGCYTYTQTNKHTRYVTAVSWMKFPTDC